MEELSLYETNSAVNEKLVVTYTPSSSVARYKYEIIKDEEVISTYEINKKDSSEIEFSETGKYKIKITEYDKYNRSKEKESGIYEVDLERPIFTVKNPVEIMQNKNGYSITELGITASDEYQGELSNIECNLDSIDFAVPGIKTLNCTVSDEAGNVASKEITLRIMKDNSNIMMAVQIGIILIILAILIFSYRTIRSLKYEKLVSKYSLKSNKEHKNIFQDKYIKLYKKINNEISSIIGKSAIIKKWSRKYVKYIPLYSDLYDNEINFMANKFIIGFSLIMIAIISKLIHYRFLELYEILIPFVFGFILPDVIYKSKYIIYRNRLENDLLQAITIMNNAFKSGRSITQAIELVAKELKGPMGLEFSKMQIELNFGLSVEDVFQRMADRVQLEEISYLTASLSVLNKTGGNIIKVFSSIEKNLFNKKRLKLELASLTSSSKMIMYILYAVPIMFILFISLVNPTYFEPFYTTSIGIILMFIMLVIYIVYIWAVQKIMKVRM